jgi:hypothetical protein
MSIFTHRDIREGNIGIGRLPISLLPPLSSIVQEYYSFIPDLNKTTYHTYYTDLVGDLKTDFDTIQNDPFWEGICLRNGGGAERDGGDGVTRNDRNGGDDRNGAFGACSMKLVPEMNELYYSNPKPDFQHTFLYGAAANLVPHRDCILFHFHSIRFYRIILGLTDNDHDTITEFIHFQQEHKLNKGDYMIFDFDKTTHQVKKMGPTETPRILMKLHFIVCENCTSIYGNSYMDFAAYFYKYYYYIARYTEQIGTDPTTFIGFFFGIMWEYPLHMYMTPISSMVDIQPVVKYYAPLSVIVYARSNHYMRNGMLGLIGDGFLAYLFIVSLFYFRYLFFGLR